MDAVLHQREEKNKRRGLLVSIAIHIALFLILLIPLFQFPIPPPGQQGILVSLGIPDMGQGEEVAASSAEEQTEQEEAEPAAAAEAQPEQEEVQEKRAASSDHIVDTKSNTPIVSEAEKKKLAEEQREKQKQAQLAEERRKQEDARKKAAEEEARKKAEYEKKKNEYGDLFGTGDGKGNTGTSGNQGSPDGDPNAKALEGISSGSGMIGGGLGNRGVLYEPSITDRSQKVGKVVVRVCVGRNGSVTEAEYTQKGSTTTDADLRSLAERSARQFKFTPSDVDKQCGTITIEFKVR